MIENTMHIGIDDTDSVRKGCTTYVAALLVEKLEHLGARFIDYPNLIRLNPNVPWKTRGNGALCLRIRCDKNVENKIKNAVINTVEKHSDLDCEGTEPGIVFLCRESIPREFRAFAEKTISQVVNLREAVRLVKVFGAEAVGFKSGRGIIGSLAAVGETLHADHTYEIIAYRKSENWGSKRKMDEASIFEMDKATAPFTFNNVDFEKNRVIITPRGPDPVLFGVRGETAEIVKRAFVMIKPLEPIERWMIFRTNQGTDAHLRPVKSISKIAPSNSVIAKGTVSESPRIVPRRHVIFSICDKTGQVDCAAYEPTGSLRRAAMELIVGDAVEAYGGVRVATRKKPLTVNLEKIRVLELAQKIAVENPTCGRCGKRLKSMGKDKGFRCEKCGSRYRNLERIETTQQRCLKRGLYITAVRSQRHLTKPFRRYEMEKLHSKIEKPMGVWHS
ncbi:MAG TPA: tRNA(Ile)(2)-agmatinylcytidine synthase [Candidatus Acidoferrum sp.]|nr:tRNA(Ile)(2)-agmatinylcytidine synthase [Candidatus Acidoferrum sp.]